MEELPANLESLLAMIEEFLTKNCPLYLKPLVPKMEGALKDLKTVVLDAREPRLAVFGRRGAGKSSLINAIFGEERCPKGAIRAQTAGAGWFTYRDKRGGLKILDTRGLGEGHKPVECKTDEPALTEIKKAVDEQCPDAILFLVKAKEVDARIDQDLKDLIELSGYIKKAKDYEAPIVGIVTQVDEVDPKQDPPPFERSKKRQNIETAKDLLAGKMKEMLKLEPTVFAVSAYMDFENGQMVYDGRWNIDTLLEYLIEHLPQSALMQLARITRVKSLQRKIGRVISGAATTLAAGVGAVPLPFADFPVLVGIQTTMIAGIGYVAGREMDFGAARDFVASLGINVGAGLNGADFSHKALPSVGLGLGRGAR